MIRSRFHLPLLGFGIASGFDLKAFQVIAVELFPVTDPVGTVRLRLRVPALPSRARSAR